MVVFVDKDLTNSARMTSVQLNRYLMVTMLVGRLLAIKMELLILVICSSLMRRRSSCMYCAPMMCIVDKGMGVLPGCCVCICKRSLSLPQIFVNNQDVKTHGSSF